jgi:localization factor PodJL
MNGWRIAEALIRLVTVAVVFAAAAILAVPGHRSGSSDGSPQPGREHPSRGKFSLRQIDGGTLAELVRCRPGTPAPAGAIRGLEDAADEKDVAAQYALGVAYLRGVGVRCVDEAAVGLIVAAANQDYAPAEYLLGVLSEIGRAGRARDLDIAASLYQRAADNGHILAMRQLGGLLLEGDAGEPDRTRAVDLYTRAANLGDTDCEFNLALMYRGGDDYGLEPSPVEAYYWIAIASQNGDRGAIDLRPSFARELDTGELDDANHRASAWRAQPANPEANADFETILDRFAEPTTSAAETPAS